MLRLVLWLFPVGHLLQFRPGFVAGRFSAIKKISLASLQSRVSILSFGAVAGDGANVASNTAAIQAAADKAADTGAVLYIDAGRYLTNGVRLAAGLAGVEGPGTLWGAGPQGTTGFVAVIESGYQGDNPVVTAGCRIDCRVDCSVPPGETVGASRGIYIKGADDITVVARVAGLTHAGARAGVQYVDCQRSAVLVDRIDGTTSTSGPTNLIGVYLVSTNIPLGPHPDGVSADSQNYGGRDHATGDFATFTSPACNNNVVIPLGEGVINGCAYGIEMFGAWYNTVTGLSLFGQYRRGGSLSPRSSYNLIAYNNVRDFGSTGFNLAYDSSHNRVLGNVIQGYPTNPTFDRAGIQAYVGSNRNKIFGNTFIGSMVFGVYTALDSQYNQIAGNVYDGVVACVGIESDWIDGGLSSPYTRANAVDTIRATRACLGHTVQVNTNVATTALYIGAGGDEGVSGISAHVEAPNVTGKVVSIHEQDGETVSGVTLTVKTDRGPSYFDLPRGRDHFLSQPGGYPFDNAEPTSVASVTGNALSVTFGDTFDLSGLTGTVTTLVDGKNGQEVMLRLGSGVTITHSTAAEAMRLVGSVSISGRTGNDFLRLKRIAGVWFEIARSW